MKSKCHNFPIWYPGFGNQHLHLKAPAVINAISPTRPPKCIEISARKLVLNGSIFIEEINKTFQKSSGCGFVFLTSVHQVCLPDITRVKCHFEK